MTDDTRAAPTPEATTAGCPKCAHDAAGAVDPANAGPETAWGDPVRYTTDDRDREERLDLVIQQGGNGDWYVSVVPEGHAAIRGVRLSTSGGASFAVPGLTGAIADAYRAMRGESPREPTLLRLAQTTLATLEASLRDAERMLDKSTVRLGILRDRMAGCSEDHGLSLDEAAAWIDEQSTTRAAPRGADAP
jgi:hypothetical protein